MQVMATDEECAVLLSLQDWFCVKYVTAGLMWFEASQRSDMNSKCGSEVFCGFSSTPEKGVSLEASTDATEGPR